MKAFWQHWYLSKHHHASPLPSCPFCHPFLESTEGIFCNSENLHEPYLEYMTIFLSRHDLKAMAERITGRETSDLCNEHRGNLDQLQSSRALQVVVAKSKSVVSLQQTCVKTVLDSMQGDRHRLKVLEEGMPGGLRKLFFINGFVKRIDY